MHLGIQCQPDVLAILGRTDGANVLDNLAAAILDDAATAGTTDQAALEGQFSPFQPLVIDTGEAHHVRCHVGGGVEAAVFLFLMNAGQLQGVDAVADFR